MLAEERHSGYLLHTVEIGFDHVLRLLVKFVVNLLVSPSEVDFNRRYTDLTM
jgi:hypothetical protein